VPNLNQHQRSKFRIALFVSTFLFISCEDNPLKQVDVSEEKIELNTLRLDRDVFNIEFSKPAEERKRLQGKYGSFWCEYVEGILQAGPCADDSTVTLLNMFVIDPYMKEAYEGITSAHTDEKIAPVDTELEEAFKYYHHYFPDSLIPQVVYFHSGLNFGIYPTDSVLAIGLDFYLGPENELVQSLPVEIFPLYGRENMKAQFMASDAMKGWLLVHNQHHFRMNDLLNTICSYGKCYYLLDAMMPHTPDSIKMNWTALETEWAEKNEANTWKELAKQEVLFETKEFEIKKWIDDGPFTNTGAIPQDSPPQLGIWMGLQIVRDYMKAHPETTLAQLMTNYNFQTMLRDYRADK